MLNGFRRTGQLDDRLRSGRGENGASRPFADDADPVWKREVGIVDDDSFRVGGSAIDGDRPLFVPRETLELNFYVR
jgi:hypothetical protein